MSTTLRYVPIVGNPNQDNTARNVTNDYQAPAYAATLNLKLQAARSFIQVAQLTGAMTVNAETTRPQIGDEMTLIFAADGTARTVTLGTGFAGSATTVVVAISKKATATFVFDGVAWIETGRAIGA